MTMTVEQYKDLWLQDDGLTVYVVVHFNLDKEQGVIVAESAELAKSLLHIGIKRGNYLFGSMLIEVLDNSN